MKKNKVLNLFGDKNIIQNTEVKYSSLLEKFMEPFANYFVDEKFFRYQEDIFEFSMNAWNFGNMASIVDYSSELEHMTSLLKNDNFNYHLLKKMMDYKVSNFKEFTNFIVDFEFDEKKGYPVLRVLTQPENIYMAKMLQEASDMESHEDDFEENYINRFAISLKPLQPLIDWVNSLHPNNPIDESAVEEVNIYLINEDISDIHAHLKKKFDLYFKMELEEWHTNKKEWPQRRNYKMFKEWFRIDISTTVYDLEKEPVSKMIE
jgi:hypothetical protein